MRDDQKEKKNNDLLVDCFFIRNCNLQKILNASEETDDGKRLISLFKNNCLMNYIKQIYMPLQEHQ